MKEEKNIQAVRSAILRVLEVMDTARLNHNERLELLCYRSIDQLKKLEREIVK